MPITNENRKGGIHISERIEFLDLVINVLREHEKKLDKIINHLERTINNVPKHKPDIINAYRISECGELLTWAIMFIIEKGLDQEFKDYLHKVRT